MIFKKCRECGTIVTTAEALELFCKSSSGKFGRACLCKLCNILYQKGYQQGNKTSIQKTKQAYYKDNKESILLKNHKYRESNKESIQKQKQDYYEENKVYIALQNKQYAKTNATEIQAQRKGYRELNKLKIAIGKRKYRQENKAKINAECAKRRAGKLRQSPRLNKEETDKLGLLYVIAQSITKNTGILMHVDHIVPLSKGGLHHPLNLKVLPASDNLSKGGILPETIPEALKALLKRFYNKLPATLESYDGC